MNTFGRLFKISIFGESHGKSIGVVIDGCPSGIPFSEKDMEKGLSRRKSGAKGTTPRLESDLPEIVSGVFNGKTSGAPIAILFKNDNTISKDYSKLFEHPRPGHADFVARVKYGGHSDYTGGGHFSGRITLAMVAAGALAEKILFGCSIKSKILELGGNKNIQEALDLAIEKKQSIGGLIECRVKGMPIGLGEPFFDSLESQLSHLIFSIPAIKAIEFGAGFQSAKMTGYEHNDLIVDAEGNTKTNHSGGINGGISNGNDLVFRVAVKPTSSIDETQMTYNFQSNRIEALKIEGRHDRCIALRVPPVLEAAAAIVLADFYLMHAARTSQGWLA